MYLVKEAYYTIQGEGANTGKPAVFCRFTGCNLWNGLEKDREKAICKFCDTNFVGTDGVNGGKFADAQSLALHILKLWDRISDNIENRFVIFTGGEPLLQLDSAVISALHALHFAVAIETNGTILPPKGVDWICVSPKAGAELILNYGNEVKVVYPQEAINPEIYESMNFNHFYLQPMNDCNEIENINSCIDYCLKNPKWRLSIQTHKLIGIS